MLATTIRSPPSVGDYVPLTEYQSQTPESFTEGKPVLHFHFEGATASVPNSQAASLAVFAADAAPVSATAGDAGEDVEEYLAEQKVDVFVSSENLTIFSHQTQAGVSIPYPAIAIHAIKRVGTDAQGNTVQAIWMQLELAGDSANDMDSSTVDLTLTPPHPDDATSSAAQQMYEAISTCSSMHPDVGDEDEDEFDNIVFEGTTEGDGVEVLGGALHGFSNGSLPPPMPGSGGWITADNAHEFFDDEGNWRGRDGEGAGRTRPRDEPEPEGVNGHVEGEGADNKRPRID